MLSVPSLTRGKGGAERVAAEMANEMSGRGHAVVIYSNSTSEEESQYDLVPEIQHIKIPLNRAHDVRQAILDVDPDVFFIFYFDFNLVAQYALVASTGIPVGGQECTNPVRAVDNLLPETPDLETAFALRKAILAGMHGIRLTMPSYIDYVPAIARPFARAFNNTFRPAKNRADLTGSNGRKRIINVGGLKGENKNGLVLTKAFARLANEFPDWDVHYVGGKNFKKLQEIIKANRLKGRVILHGFKDDVYAEYQKAQIHVICSFEEGCPNVVCEAMLHGIPTIGFSDCRGTNELVIDGQNGVLVDRGREVENLAGALGQLMSDADLRGRLGDAAYADAKERFDGNKIYDYWEELLSRISSYKADAERLHREQCKIDPEEARNMRRLRTRFLKEYGKAYYIPGQGVTNEKITSEKPPLVSIVIPVFNKEAYIAETLDSVLACVYPNIEILAVDDCSTDDSLNIMRAYEEHHDHLRVITRARNGGLSAARNSGLREATGVYISFWDADDVYSPEGLGEIVDIMEVDGSEIATGMAMRDGSVLPHYEPANFLARRTDFHRTPEAFSTMSSCFKIYRHSFLRENNLEFVPGLYMQDMEFNMRAFLLARHVSVTPYVIGEYRYVDNSWGRSMSAARMDSSFQISDITRAFVLKNRLEAYEAFRQRHVIKFVFIFFLRRLLLLKNAGNLGEYKPYLEKYRHTLLAYRAGIRELAKTNPNWSIGIVAFCSEEDELALDLLQGKRRKEAGRFFRNNAFGFTREDIAAMLEQPALTKKQRWNLWMNRFRRILKGRTP